MDSMPEYLTIDVMTWGHFCYIFIKGSNDYVFNLVHFCKIFSRFCHRFSIFISDDIFKQKFVEDVCLLGFSAFILEMELNYSVDSISLKPGRFLYPQT